MSTLDRSERVALARLHALLELLPTALDKELSSVGLTSFEYTLLQALGEVEQGRLRLSALASKTNATLPRLSRVVTGLERKGLVLRAACDMDGRATNAVLTDAGRETLGRAEPVYADAARRLVLSGLGSLNDNGVEQLSRVSYAVLGALDPRAEFAVTADGQPLCPADPVCEADPA